MKYNTTSQKVLRIFYRSINQAKRLCRYSTFLAYYKLTRHRKKALLEYKNKFYGKSIYIIGTGPSLTIEDLEMLQGQYSISVNGIVNYYDSTTFRPTFFMIQDSEALKKLAEKINQSDMKDVFVGMGNRYNMKYNIDRKHLRMLRKNLISYNLNSLEFFGPKDIGQISKCGFCNDFSLEAYDGGSVIFSAIQFAVYMGFKKIYLLGCDCTDGHFYDGQSKMKPNPWLITVYEFYKSAIASFDREIEIINCSRGGALEVFRREKLEKTINLPHFEEKVLNTISL